MVGTRVPERQGSCQPAVQGADQVTKAGQCGRDQQAQGRATLLGGQAEVGPVPAAQLGGGVGAVRSKLKLQINCAPFDVDDAQWRFAIQGFVGADFLINQAARIGLRYNFLHTNDINRLDNTICGACATSLDPNSHSITRHSFGPRSVL